MGLRERLTTWSDAHSPWGRARREVGERRELLARIPLSVAHRAVEQLVARPLAIDPEAPGYTVWLVAALEGLVLGDQLVITRGPVDPDSMPEPPEPDALVVGEETDRCFYTVGDSLEVHSVGDSAAVAPSLAHLVLDRVLSTKDLRALGSAVSPWVPRARHRRRIAGASAGTAPLDAFELDARPRHRALAASLIALGVPVFLCGTSTLMSRVYCGASVVALGLASVFALGASVRLEELLVLEPRLRAMAPDADGFTYEARRHAWSELAELKHSASTSMLVLADGPKIMLGYTGFRHPDAARRAIARACARKGGARYRDR